MVVPLTLWCAGVGVGGGWWRLLLLLLLPPPPPLLLLLLLLPVALSFTHSPLTAPAAYDDGDTPPTLPLTPQTATDEVLIIATTSTSSTTTTRPQPAIPAAPPSGSTTTTRPQPAIPAAPPSGRPQPVPPPVPPPLPGSGRPLPPVPGGGGGAGGGGTYVASSSSSSSSSLAYEGDRPLPPLPAGASAASHEQAYVACTRPPAPVPGGDGGAYEDGGSAAGVVNVPASEAMSKVLAEMGSGGNSVEYLGARTAVERQLGRPLNKDEKDELQRRLRRRVESAGGK